MRESPNHEIKTKNNRNRQRTQIEFRMQLAHQMLGAFISKRKYRDTGVSSTRANALALCYAKEKNVQTMCKKQN